MKKKMILKKTINKAILLFMMISVLLGVSGCSSEMKMYYLIHVGLYIM